MVCRYEAGNSVLAILRLARGAVGDELERVVDELERVVDELDRRVSARVISA